MLLDTFFVNETILGVCVGGGGGMELLGSGIAEYKLVVSYRSVQSEGVN